MVEKSITGVVTWLKNWFYDSDQVDTFLNSKANKNLGTAGMNVVTDASGEISLEAKPTIPTVPSASSTTPSADTNSGAVGTGTTWARADHKHPKSSIYAEASHDHTVSEITDFPSTMTPSSHTHGNLQNNGQVGSTAQANKNVVTDSSGKITTEDKYSHPSTHSASIITDANANTYTNMGSLSSGATQQAINSAINTKLGNLIDTNLIEITTDKGSADASKMNKFYVETKNGKTDIYYVVRSGTSGNYTYTWDDLDTDVLDNVTIPTDVSDLTDTQNTAFTPKSHWHGRIGNEGKLHLASGSSSVYKNYLVGTNGNGDIIGYDKKTSSLTNDGADGTHLYVTDDDSRLTDARTPTSHNQATTTITNSETYSNLGSSLTNQKLINDAINTTMGGKGAKTDDIDWSYNSDGFVNGIKLHPKGTNTSADEYGGKITFHLKS